jgi:Ca2+:H+ antiporter
LWYPAVFHWLSRGIGDAPELELDTEIAVVLFATYCASLVFTLKTHRVLYEPAADSVGRSRRAAHETGVWTSVLTLCAATGGVALVGDLLVDTVTEPSQALGVSQLFMGVVIVASIGNVTEHYSAVMMALGDKMDATLAISGSSTQIALFVAPALVFLSYAVAPQPMDLLFTVYEIVAIALAVLSIAFIAHDGETHWMDGVQLLAIYIILALGFYFLPA